MAKAIGYLKPDIDPNTRLYVPFNEGVGNVAKDYSQYGNHAQLTDVEWSPDGFNGAGKFNGSSSFGDCGNPASLNISGPITIEAWVKFAATNVHQGIIAHDNGVNHSYDLWFREHSQVELALWDSLGTRHNVVANSLPQISEYYHLVGTYDGSIQKIYVNGVQQTDTSSWSGTLKSTLINLTIGIRTDLTLPFNGTIDEVWIYALTLSAAQNAADCYEIVCS